MENFDWTCPFCGRHATITEQSIHTAITRLTIGNAEGPVALTSEFVVCPNPKCKKYTLRVLLARSVQVQQSWWSDYNPHKQWDLIPASKAQVLPDYVPQAVRDDYNEACA